MRLNLNDIKKIDDSQNIIVPKYDIKALKEQTLKTPKWLHFGAGNIFRAFMGKIQQELIETNKANTGIIVAESFDTQIIEKAYKPFDNLTILTTLNKDGEFQNEIIGSIVESIEANEKNFALLEEIVKNSSLQIISFTVTEKGYNLKNTEGNYFDIILQDFENGFKSPKHIMSLITRLLYTRFKSEKLPISLVSMDNCSANGDRIKEAVIDIAKHWEKNGFVE